MRPLLFLDTETTSLDEVDREAWEIAVIRRDADGTESQLHLFVDVDLVRADPEALEVGGYYRRHPIGRWLANPNPAHAPRPDFGCVPVHPDRPDSPQARFVTRAAAAAAVARISHRATPVGINPAFDMATLGRLLRTHHHLPQWDYRMINVRDLAIGYLAGRMDIELDTPTVELSRACGLTGWVDRHTALGDALWTQAWFDKICAIEARTLGPDDALEAREGTQVAPAIHHLRVPMPSGGALSDYEDLRRLEQRLRDRFPRFANQLAGQSKGMQAALDEALQPLLAERDALRAKIGSLADWHETKAEKAKRFRPEDNGENHVMDKAAEVHAEAARRLRRALDGGSDE